MPRDRTRTYATMHRLRKLEEEARAREATLAHHAVLRGQRVREGLENTRRAALNSAAELMQQPEIDASDMRTYFQYERHLAGAIDRQDAENMRLDRVLEQRRAELQAAAVRRKIIERLAEQERERREKAALEAERKTMDEAAIVRALLASRKAGEA